MEEMAVSYTHLDVYKRQQVDHVTISSSLIRKLLLDGDIKKVNKYLGRNYSISGKVIQGKGLGKKISIPTANIEIDNSLALPRSGVYHTKILYRGKIYVCLLYTSR